MNQDCPNRETLLRFVDGSMGEEDVRTLGEHLERCEACRLEISALRRLVELLRSAGSVRHLPAAGVCPDGETLAAYADGSLSAARSLEFEEHLAGCAACVSELADLWALSGPPTMDAPDSAVAAALSRLDRSARTAMVRWSDKAVELVRDFATALSEVVSSSGLEPALAAASRAASEPVALNWAGSGLEVRAIVESGADGPSVTGHVSSGSGDTAAVSVSMSWGGGKRGPESLDAAGRFGPWTLVEGSNVLRLTGGPLASGRPLELVIEVTGPEGSD